MFMAKNEIFWNERSHMFFKSFVSVFENVLIVLQSGTVCISHPLKRLYINFICTHFNNKWCQVSWNCSRCYVILIVVFNCVHDKTRLTSVLLNKWIRGHVKWSLKTVYGQPSECTLLRSHLKSFYLQYILSAISNTYYQLLVIKTDVFLN